jgi:hypothetical protein
MKKKSNQIYLFLQSKMRKKGFCFAQMLCEMSLKESAFLRRYLPSTIAASALALARHEVYGSVPSAEWMREVTKADPTVADSPLRPCIEKLEKMYASRQTTAKSVFDKYMNRELFHVSSLELKGNLVW